MHGKTQYKDATLNMNIHGLLSYLSVVAVVVARDCVSREFRVSALGNILPRPKNEGKSLDREKRRVTQYEYIPETGIAWAAKGRKKMKVVFCFLFFGSAHMSLNLRVRIIPSYQNHINKLHWSHKQCLFLITI